MIASMTQKKKGIKNGIYDESQLTIVKYDQSQKPCFLCNDKKEKKKKENPKFSPKKKLKNVMLLTFAKQGH